LRIFFFVDISSTQVTEKYVILVFEKFPGWDFGENFSKKKILSGKEHRINNTFCYGNKIHH